MVEAEPVADRVRMAQLLNALEHVLMARVSMGRSSLLLLCRLQQ